MTERPYIELHARSAFSFLEGASQPDELATLAAHFSMPALALLDTDGVYGAARFHLAAKRAGIQAHIGAEVSIQYLVPGTQKKQNQSQEVVRLPVLAESRQGYQNLCRMITRMKLRAGTKTPEAPAFAHELAEFAPGMVCLTGGAEANAPLAAAFERGRKSGGAAGAMEEGRKLLAQLISAFGAKNVYVELQRHFMRKEEAHNQSATALAREFHLPLLATNGVRYAVARERELLDAFTCIRNHTRLDHAGRLLSMNSARHLRAAEEMWRLFRDVPEALHNTVELSSRLEFTLADLGYEFPRYPVPEGETMMSFLRARTMEAARQQYRPLYDRARRQIERELVLIERLELAGYFLIVWDLVRFCREQKILVQGRGSAANSAVCYSLGITAVDPVGMDLLFERFLSEERGEWPDIDLDLPSGDERERVIQYVYRRYGRLGAAMTANVITYRGRSAAREMGKVLGFDDDSVDRLSKLVGSWEWKDPEDTPERQFTQAGFDLRHPRIARFMDLCLRVRDLPRHLGQHSGGMVICQGQLDSVVPLEPASMPGRVVVQWDKDDCTDLGIIKVDLLGLGMMAVLRESIDLIREHHQEEVDIAHLPQEDPAVYKALQQADTIGMFQVESRAQMASLPRNHPENFYDIVVQVALIRPGPIVGKMTNPYMKRRQGKEAVTYPHPSLEPVLERTLGVPLFQEQLLRMAMICANFTGGQAEELRRALGSKRSERRMREIENKLRAGMGQNGIDEKTQDEIVQFITSFALYGFPESHAASFALIAYASAYLKCNYLAAFTAALLNNQPMGFYHPSTLVKNAQRHGLRVLPVDVLQSQWDCTLEKLPTQSFAMRVGLRYVRGLRVEAAHAIVRERELRGFSSVDDLARSVPELRKNDLVMLAQVGALNSVGSAKAQSKLQQMHRRDALWQVERAANPTGPLLSPLEELDKPSPLEPMTSDERLIADFQGIGLTVGPHPMHYRRAGLDQMGILRAADLARFADGDRIRYAGSVITRQRPGTAHGFIFLSMEDESGIANVIITPNLYAKNRMVVMHERFLLIEGVLQHKERVVHIKAEAVKRLNGTEIESPQDFDHAASAHESERNKNVFAVKVPSRDFH